MYLLDHLFTLFLRTNEKPFPQSPRPSAHAIYQIEGRTLTIAGNEPGNAAWPTGFERSQVNQTRVFVFTKQ